MKTNCIKKGIEDCLAALSGRSYVLLLLSLEKESVRLLPRDVGLGRNRIRVRVISQHLWSLLGLEQCLGRADRAKLVTREQAFRGTRLPATAPNF